MNDAVVDAAPDAGAHCAPCAADAAVASGPSARHVGPLGLAVGAIGVVFGDIGTSPLYALRDTFAGNHPLPLDRLHIYGIVSLMFWSMMLIVTLKYVTVIMRADNKGSGGSLALLALINQHTTGRRWGKGIIVLGVLATALFYSDSMLTPAVSIMSAVEGISVYNPALHTFVVPLVVAVVIALFMLKSRHTGTAINIASNWAGPIMLVYFATISLLGLRSIAVDPQVVWALSPECALAMFMADPWHGFIAMGTAVLAVTGAEALYADMGQFGRSPIRVSWLVFVLPALVLNYLGQAALLLRDPGAIHSPFYLLAPPGFEWPLLVIATSHYLALFDSLLSPRQYAQYAALVWPQSLT